MILQNPSSLGYIPKRIVSLVPSQTELLYTLGLETETIGITKFCTHPPHWLKTKQITGGTKNLKANKIRDLLPDLIIANKEENVKGQIELLAADYPVWVSDVNNLEDALKMIDDIGILTGKSSSAKELCSQIKNAFSSLPIINRPLRTAYLIWQNPYMTVGGDTYINDMLRHCGLENVFSNKIRYPEVTVNDIASAGCDLVILSSEPYPFKQKHLTELTRQLPDTKIILANGEFFSWYGSRLLLAPDYFKSLSTSCFSKL